MAKFPSSVIKSNLTANALNINCAFLHQIRELGYGLKNYSIYLSLKEWSEGFAIWVYNLLQIRTGDVGKALTRNVSASIQMDFRAATAANCYIIISGELKGKCIENLFKQKRDCVSICAQDEYENKPNALYCPEDSRLTWTRA